MELVVVNTKSRIKSADLYKHYLDWCQDTNITCPAKSNKFGTAIKRLFDSELWQYYVDGTPTYFYDQIQYVSPKRHEDFCKHVTILDHTTLVVENELIVVYFSTNIFVDHDILDYQLSYSKL